MDRIYLNAPYSQREEAKAAGAKWDGGKKLWWVPDNIYYDNPSNFNKWLSQDTQKTLLEHVPASIEDEIYKNLFGDKEPRKYTPITERANKYFSVLNSKEFEIWNTIISTSYCENSFLSILNSKLVTDKTIFIDTETTGLNDPEVIELGIVNHLGEEIYHSFFKPNKPIERGASIVNNITNNMLQFEPVFTEKWNEIEDILLSADRIYAYNSPYDARAIENTLKKYNLDTSLFVTCKKKFIDAQPILVDYINNVSDKNDRKLKLQTVADMLKLNFKEKHSASSDAYLILLCFNNMKENKSNEPVKQSYKCFETLDDMQNFIATIIDNGGTFINYIPSTNPMLIYVA